MAPVRRAPYKDFLQPALHRRFTSTASILLGIAFVEAVFLANWDSRQLRPAPAIQPLLSDDANGSRTSQASGRSSRLAQQVFEPSSYSSAAWPSSSSELHNTMSACALPTPGWRPSRNMPSLLRRWRPWSPTRCRHGSSARFTCGRQRRILHGCQSSRAWEAGCG